MTIQPASGVTTGPQRLCPSCGSPDRISNDSRLWPLGWRCQSCGKGLDIQLDLACLSQDAAGGTFDEAAFSPLAELEATHFWFISRNRLINWLVEKFAPEAHRVLEIGCGTGFVLHALRESLPGAMLAGSELHISGLSHARHRHGSGVELFQMDACRCYFSAALDLVGAFDVLEHIPKDEDALAAIAIALKPGGVVIASVPQHRWMWSTADDLACHQRRYRRGELAKKMRKAGLEPLYESSFMTLPFPLMMLSRALEWFARTPKTLEQQVADEFRLPAWQNRMLLMLLAAEQYLRRYRVPFPFGGSQIVVARRPF